MCRKLFFICFMGFGGSEFIILIGKIILLDIDTKKFVIMFYYYILLIWN